jgi:hypothetical protein
MFSGRKLVIATMHRKEQVIAPLMEKELGVKCLVANNINTDQFGTFTGEIERIDNPLNTARNKCLLAIELTNCDIAVASEGSFGIYPSMLLVPANVELLMLLDKKNKLEIIARNLSTETNFNASEITSLNKLEEFAKQSLFPSHALIIKNEKTNFKEVVKGINSFEILKKTFNYFIEMYGKAFVETDMRAIYNPTRMKAIEETTKKLIGICNSFCPRCNTPGYSISSSNSGLPCENCKTPTQSILSNVYTCIKCSFSQTQMFPYNKKSENPMYCSFCNP